MQPKNTKEHTALGDAMLAAASENAKTVLALEEGAESLQHAAGIQEAHIESILGTIQNGVSALRSLTAEADGTAAAMNEAAAAAQRGYEKVGTLVSDIQVMSSQISSSGAFLGDLRSTIEKIVGASEAIKDITEDLSVIAINTAIEAARAGEKGKGFAVLAREIRKLAERSGSLSDSIGVHVKEAGQKLEVVHGSVQAADASSRSAADLSRVFSDDFDNIAGKTGEARNSVSRFSSVARERLEAEEAIAINVKDIARESETIVLRSRDTATLAAELRKATEISLSSMGGLRTSRHEQALGEAMRLRELLSETVLDDTNAVNKILHKSFNLSDAFELLYLLDARGRQISDNIVHPSCSGSISTEGYGVDRSDREYYCIPRDTREPYVSAAYLSSASGSLCLTVAVPLFDQRGTLRAVLAADISAASFSCT